MTLAETFDSLDWLAVEAFIEQGQEEHLHIDFKLAANSELSSKEDKRNIARAISGFGNSAGGLVIWGIDARKNADGVDCAVAIRELENPAKMVTRLNALSGEATAPIVDGLRHKPILNPATSGGVVATLVPESEGGPYMARLGEQRYYKRSGDSFYQMEHFDLEDMFGRRQKPKLEIVFEEGKKAEGVEDLIVLLINQGRAVARHAGFLMTFQNVEIVEVGPEMENISHVNAGRPVVAFDKQTGVLHPNGIRMNLGSIRVRRKDPTLPIQGDVVLYCEGMQHVRRSLSVAPIPPATTDEAPAPSNGGSSADCSNAAQ